MRIIVQFPTRGRAMKAAVCLATHVQGQSGRHHVTYHVVVDHDDEQADEFIRMAERAVGECPRAALRVTRGNHQSKIEACNAGVPDPMTWDVLLMSSDDMWPEPGWDARLADDYAAHWPLGDGCLHYDDGNQMKLCTYPIMGPVWYAQCGFVYNPVYFSLWADNEAHAVAARRGRMRMVLGGPLLRHRHPAYDATVERDALYERNEALHDRDRRVFEMQRSGGYGLVDPALSVCICSVPERFDRRKRLFEELKRQVIALGDDGMLVELLLDQRICERDGGPTVGAKRNALLKQAQGAYVVFIDDDDMVADDYLRRLLNQLVNRMIMGESLDAVGFYVHRVDFKRREEAVYLVDPECKVQPEWDGRRRPVNHIAAVRREIALAAGFPETSWGEDGAYAARLAPLITCGAVIPMPPMYTYEDDATRSLTRRHRIAAPAPAERG